MNKVLMRVAATPIWLGRRDDAKREHRHERVIGWIVAGVIGGVLAKFLRTIRIDDLAERSGVAGFLRRARVRADAAGVIGGLVKWYVRLVFVLLAANAVGLTAVSGIVNQVLAFIPNLLVAILILGVFSWLATTGKDLVGGAVESAGMPNGNALGMLTSSPRPA